jgi:hypothetical protein
MRPRQVPTLEPTVHTRVPINGRGSLSQRRCSHTAAWIASLNGEPVRGSGWPAFVAEEPRHSDSQLEAAQKAGHLYSSLSRRRGKCTGAEVLRYPSKEIRCHLKASSTSGGGSRPDKQGEERALMQLLCPTNLQWVENICYQRRGHLTQALLESVYLM